MERRIRWRGKAKSRWEQWKRKVRIVEGKLLGS